MGTADRILSFVWTWQQEHAYCPSVREILAGTGISSTSVVMYNLKKLRAAGLVEFTDGDSRTVRITGSRYVLPAQEPVNV
jgi:repressor LexA